MQYKSDQVEAIVVCEGKDELSPTITGVVFH